MVRLRSTLSLMTILLPEDIALKHKREHFPPPKANKIICRNYRAAQILLDKLTSRLTKNNINLFQPLILRLGHKQDLVELAKSYDPVVKSESKTNLGHYFLYLHKEVSNKEGAEE